MKIDNWLLLRGLVRETRHWHSFPEIFAQRFPQSQIHRLDLPGIGTESHRKSPTTIDDIVGDLKDRWNDLHQAHPGNWGILSLSLGSMLSLRWCDLYPTNFDAQVIMNTSALNLSLPWQRLKPFILLELLKSSLQSSPVKREAIVLGATTNKLTNLNEVAETLSTFALPSHQQRLLALRQLKAAITFDCPEKINVPTLALLSKGDHFTDFSCTLKIAQQIQCPVEIHPTAGHDLPLDAPEWVSDKVADWLVNQN